MYQCSIGLSSSLIYRSWTRGGRARSTRRPTFAEPLKLHVREAYPPIVIRNKGLTLFQVDTQ